MLASTTQGRSHTVDHRRHFSNSLNLRNRSTRAGTSFFHSDNPLSQMEINLKDIRIDHHTVVDEKSPFLVFILEL
jgi:hypothetical protein